MRKSASKESSQRMTSRALSVATLTKMKMATSDKLRKSIRPIPQNRLSIVQKREKIRVTDNGDDVTPKLLIHNEYGAIEERHLNALDTLGGSISGSNTLLNLSSSIVGGFRLSSSNVVMSSTHTAILGGDEIHIDSLLSTEHEDEIDFDEDKAPSAFYLPIHDPNVFYVRPERVTIVLRETETFFIFEMPQLTADLRTPEGAAVVAENERYKYITGPGSNRKLTDAETQTPQIHTKTRGTYIGRHKRHNQGTFVSNWEMYDTYKTLDLMEEVNGILYPPGSHSRKSRGKDIPSYKFPKAEIQPEILSQKDQLLQIYNNTSFMEAARVTLRILASNFFITAQKRFTGLIKQDPYAMDLELTYSLDLLWIFSANMTIGRTVSCFCWSYENSSVLAVGYNSRSKETEGKDGMLIIWCAKNPSHYGRNYYFKSAISSLDWSKTKPNWLAVGFYDGTVKVIDVKDPDLLIIRKSQRETSPSYDPHWQVQWWSEEDHLDQESVYTSNQDGRIFHYRTGEDFICMEVLKIPRIEGKIDGVKRTTHGVFNEVPISRNPGILVLRKHPTMSNIYFVGTDEGCVHRCSTKYLHQHIDSFQAHDGPIYSMEFSPHYSKIFLTAGADWCTRIWAEGTTEPLITLSTKMAWVRSAAWSPINSTIIATIVENEICIWDIKRKTYKPTSIKVLSDNCTLLQLEFTRNGNQLVAGDNKGAIYIYNLEGMPFAPFDQVEALMSSIEKALITKPDLLKKLKKLKYKV